MSALPLLSGPAAPRPGPGRPRRRLRRLLRQPGQRAAHRRRLPGRRRPGDHRGHPAAPGRRGAPDGPRRLLPVRAGGDHGDRPGHRGLGGARGHAGRPVVRVRRPAGLRRGRAPLRHRAVRHAGRAALDRPADRPAAPGHPARAAPLPRGLPVRPRPDPGAAVRAAVRGDHRGADRPALRGRAAVHVRPSAGPPARRGLAGRRGVAEASGGGAGRPLAAGPGPAHPRRPPAHPDRGPAWSRGWRPASSSCRPGTSRWCRSSSTPVGSSWRRSRREFPELLPALVDHHGIGFALVRTAEFGPIVFGRDGAHRLSNGTLPARTRSPPTARTPPTSSAASTASRTAPTS